MGTEWIAEFQQEMDKLEAQLRSFLDVSPSLDLSRHEQRFLNHCVEVIHNMLVWSRALSYDDAVWALVDVPRLCHQMIGRLTIASGYFDLMSKDHKPADAAASIKTLTSSCYQVGYIIGGSQRGDSRPWMNSPFYTLRPEILLEVLRVSLYPNYISVWDVSPMPANVFVPFHPYHTQRLLCFLVEQFKELARSYEATLRATATTECLTMTITGPHIQLTDVRWRDFLVSLRSSAHDETIEVWREMGGSIDPLTWNTGQGEGVIVRLPWAKTS